MIKILGFINNYKKSYYDELDKNSILEKENFTFKKIFYKHIEIDNEKDIFNSKKDILICMLKHDLYMINKTLNQKRNDFDQPYTYRDYLEFISFKLSYYVCVIEGIDSFFACDEIMKEGD